jgi:hypothetical protein
LFRAGRSCKFCTAQKKRCGLTEETSRKQKRNIPDSEKSEKKKNETSKQAEKRKREETEEEEEEEDDDDDSSEYRLRTDREWRDFVEGRFIGLDQLIERKFRWLNQNVMVLSRKIDGLRERKRRRDGEREKRKGGEEHEDGDVNMGE